MAAFEASAESKIIPISAKIAELKKRITLAEGQKKATVEVWNEKERKATDLATELRKTIKELSAKLMCHINASDGKHSANSNDTEISRTVTYPYGADSAQKAFEFYDLQVINRTKEYDRLDAQYVQRRAAYEHLLDRQTELEIYQKTSSEGRPTEDSRPPKSAKSKQPVVDEDESRKQVCRLENEIIRINEQWLQAETIGRKYKDIRSTLMGDATKFEQNLVEIENALEQQNGDIDNIEKVNKESVHMRDATKLIVLRQEHNSQMATKARVRLLTNFRKQGEEHKQELERLERKLLTITKPLTRQGSMESLSGDGPPTDPNATLQSAKDSSGHVVQLETQLKSLMQVTGATSPADVLNRFIVQKEATTRLNYLRTVTETEKWQLEKQRDDLTSTMETLCFAVTKESDVNQEYLEQLKKDIVDMQTRQNHFLQAAAHSKSVLNSIRSTIIDLIQKLDDIESEPIAEGLILKAPNVVLLEILGNKLKMGLMMSGELHSLDDGQAAAAAALEMEDLAIDTDKLHLNLNLLSPKVPTPSAISTPRSTRSRLNTELRQSSTEMEKSTPYPLCYANLLAGRSTTGVSTSTTPGHTAQPVVPEEEQEVPSRSLLKRQALVIVDMKSRRKGYRAPKRK